MSKRNTTDIRIKETVTENGSIYEPQFKTGFGGRWKPLVYHDDFRYGSDRFPNGLPVGTSKQFTDKNKATEQADWLKGRIELAKKDRSSKVIIHNLYENL